MRETEKGSFTLPGESGYEELTLQLARLWGADMIRDSDGTVLSDELTNAGYGIYSTICLIRDHNEWAKAHPEQLQQTFLVTEPRTGTEVHLSIPLMEDFYKDQFRVNESPESIKYWQVYDRTSNQEISPASWSYDSKTQSVAIMEICPFHEYTVNFLAYRIWEEISMYNHVTNHWEKEHLMPLDPRHEETRSYLYSWLKTWCGEHPATTVVRFTSLFYNFTWMWGSSERKRNLFSDWGSYDFTVSPAALKEFEEEYGYCLVSEDFINQGKFHVTHMPPGRRQLDYMAFINRFVVDYGKQLVELVHSFGKKASVFYDDSWIGLEPYHSSFNEIGFDGIIKCVFSGYEARLCAGVPVKIHELRLHPYLFPVGLNGTPTFAPGGNPTKDALEYWNRVRRAILRQKIDRIGLGGYLHLVEKYPDFCSCIENIAGEFRQIKELHEKGGVYTLPIKAAVVHAWGKLRSWTLSGHFHETYMHDLIHINEALSGLPVQVEFLNFEDIKNGALNHVDVLINAGASGTAWSGGDGWKDDGILEETVRFVHRGGCFIGVNEPSAADGYHTFFRMAQVLGIDQDTGSKVCHGRMEYKKESIPGVIPEGACIKGKKGLYLTDRKTSVLAEEDQVPAITYHEFGAGAGIYLSSFQFSCANTRMLMNLMLYSRKMSLKQNYLTDNPETECAWYPDCRTLVIINNSENPQTAAIETDSSMVRAELAPYETVFKKI